MAEGAARTQRATTRRNGKVIAMQQHDLRLEVRGLVKRYGRQHALKGVDLQIRAGEVVALLGQNGAGKSTLVKALSGLVKADDGSIKVDGQTVDLSNSKESQRAGIAVVQQEISAVRTMTVAENLVLGQITAPPIWIRRRLESSARRLLATVGLEALDPRTELGDLSVAEAQLVEIARVISRDARIVIFDEPTAALSDSDVARVLGVVRRLSAEGRAVIYVTHRLNEVFEIADRVAIFREGECQGIIDVKELDVDQIVERMIGRPQKDIYPEPGALERVVLSINELAIPGMREPISLDVRAGEILGLCGQIGGGSELLLRGLAGMVRGVAGTVSVDGFPLNLRNRRSGIRAGVAYCSSERKLDGIFAHLSVKDNLSSPWLTSVARRGVVSRRGETSKALEAARAFTLDVRRMNSPVGTLSGGNQQKVALGKWLGTQPRVLLVEEPTRGVDVGARAEIYAHLRKLSQTGMAVIISSSDTSEVLGLSDTVGSFYAGHLTGVGPRKDWTEADLLRKVVHHEIVGTSR